MTIKELQALSTVADMLIELARDTKIPFYEAEQKLSELEREDYRPPCDCCKMIKHLDYIRTDYMNCPVIYCPACGRLLRAKEVQK